MPQRRTLDRALSTQPRLHIGLGEFNYLPTMLVASKANRSLWSPKNTCTLGLYYLCCMLILLAPESILGRERPVGGGK